LKKSKRREDEKTQNFISIAFLFTLTAEKDTSDEKDDAEEGNEE
jgi:hypothetical protein